MVFTFVVTAVIAAMNLVSLLFMTNYLGVDPFGTISIAMSLTTVAATVADFGFSSAHIKRLSEGKDLNECVSTYTTVKLVGSFAAIIVMTLGFLLWFFTTSTIDPNLPATYFLFLGYYILVGIANLAIHTYNARTEVVKSSLLSTVDPLLRTPILVLVCLAGLGPVAVGWSYFIGGAAMAVLAIMFLLRMGIKWQRPVLFRNYSQFALPLAFITIITILNGNLDKIIIGAFDGSTNVGYYNAGKMLLNMFLMIGVVVNVIVFPTFSRLHTVGDVKSLRSMTNLGDRYLAILVVPVVGAIIMFPEQLSVAVFGPDFAETGRCLAILAVGTALVLVNVFFDTQIYAVNRADIAMKINLISFAINVALLLVLVPGTLFGVTMMGWSFVGAAYAYLASTLFILLADRWAVARLTSTRTSPRMGLHLLALTLDLVVLFLVGPWLVGYSLLGLAVLLLISFGVYVGVLFLLREFARSDIDYILQALNLRDMGSYIKEETGIRKK
jgi:O-antigen/teichoic acid export membrane protein